MSEQKKSKVTTFEDSRMTPKQKEIVKADEQAIKKLEREMDDLFNQGQEAKKAGDMDRKAELDSQWEAKRPVLEKMRDMALKHVNRKSLDTGPVKEKDFKE